MSEYLENIKKFSLNNKLIYSSPHWEKAISHIETIESQNESLLAQVEELKRAMLYEAGETRAEFNVPDEVSLLLETVANKFPDQHLCSLKARIENEAIARCAKTIETLLKSIDGSADLPDHAGMLENLTVNMAIDLITYMPRKYLSAKADK